MPSTIGGAPARDGLTEPRKYRRHAVPNPDLLLVAASANDVWGIDFEGLIRTGDRARCDPLTVE